MKYVRHITSVLIIILIAVLAAGTVVEKLHGNEYALTHIYSAWWFIALWAGFGIIAAAITFFRPADGLVRKDNNPADEAVCVLSR